MFPQTLPLVLQMCPLIFLRIPKNKKPCEFTYVFNKELLALALSMAGGRFLPPFSDNVLHF